MQPAQQDENVEKIVDAEVVSLAELRPEDIKCIDPCMGSGHGSGTS